MHISHYAHIMQRASGKNGKLDSFENSRKIYLHWVTILVISFTVIFRRMERMWSHRTALM